MDNRQRTLWILSEVFYPSEEGTGYYLNKIASSLASKLKVKVLTCHARQNPPINNKKVEIYQGVEIYRSIHPPFDKNKLIQRMLRTILTTLSMLGLFLKHARPGDVVFIVTNPPTLPLLLIPIARLRGIKSLLRVDDIYPDSFAVSGLIENKGLIFRILALLNRYCYRMADEIVTLGKDMREAVEKRMGDSNKNVHIIPNWADLDIVTPEPKSANALYKRINPSNKFLVLIAGNIGRVQGVADYLEAMSLLRDNSNVQFLIVGSGALSNHLNEQISKRGLSNVCTLPNQPREKQNEFLNACDIAMLSLSAGMYGLGVPSRFYNYLAAGKPVLAVVDPQSEIATVINTHQVGWLAQPGNPEDIARAILVAQQCTTLERMGQMAHQLARNQFSPKSIIDRYQQLIVEMMRRDAIPEQQPFHFSSSS